MYRKGLFAAFFALVTFQMLHAQVTANFTAPQTTGCAPSPLNVFLTNTSTGGITGSAWTVFNQGGTSVFTSTVTNPTFSFTVPGKYTVRLIVSGPGGPDTLTQADFVELFDAPVPSFTLSKAEGCAPLTTQLQNTSVANASGFSSIAWTFNPANIPAQSGATPTISVATPGTYDINLIVTNTNGCQAFTTMNDVLTVHAQSTASFSSPNSTACIAPQSVNFTSATTFNNPLTGTCQWSFPGGTPSSFTGCTPPAVTYSTPGNYAVTLTLPSSEPSCEVSVTVPSFVSIGSINSDFTVPALVCAGQTATFSAVAPSSGTFSWDFTNNGSYDATGTSVNRIYPSAGTFSIKLKVDKGPGCVDSTIKTVTVNASPTANFTIPVTSSCAVPATFNFTNTSLGVASTSWSFGAQGSPQTSTAASPSVTYSTFGQYTATLTVTNANGCSASKSQALNVSAPQANFTASTTGGCLPVNITFQDASTASEPIVGWNWRFGNGTGTDGISPGTSTAQNPAATITQQGAYDVRLIITTQSGCQDTLEVNGMVRGDALPLVDFMPFGITSCAKDTNTFNSLHVSPGWTYAWDFEYDAQNGFSTNQTGAVASYSWSDTGFFDIALVITNNTCTDTMVHTNAIYINSPIAKFEPAATTLCSLPATFTFNDSTVQPGTLWEWMMDGTIFLSSAVSTNPTFTFNNVAQLGPHTVKLRVSNSVTGCVDSVEHTIFVGNPVAGFSTTDVFGCRAYAVNFTNTSANATGYQWFVNGSNFSASAAPTLTLPDSGHYGIRLIVSDAFGCQDTAEQLNLIHVVGPYAKITAPTVTGCAPMTASLLDNSETSGGATLTNWLWNFGDPNANAGNPNTSVAQNPSHIYSAAGNYTVQLKVTDSFGCQDSVTRPNLIAPTFPDPDFTTADASTCAGPGATGISFQNTSVGASLSYQWQFGDGTTATSTNPVHIYTSATLPVTVAQQYSVKLIATDINGCVDSLEKVNMITIEPFSAGFVADDTFSDCPPLNSIFNDSTSVGNIASYQWTFGDGGTAVITDPTHTYVIPGDYDVSLVVTHPDGCRDTLVQAGFINVDGPRGTMQASPAIVCPLEATTFTVITDRTDSVVVVYGDGTFDTQGGLNVNGDTVTFSHAYTTPGIKIISLSGSLLTCSRSITTTTVEVSTPPTAAIAMTDTTPCEDAAAAFFNQSVAGSVALASQHWTLAPGVISPQQNPTHIYATPGPRTVQLVVTDSRFCRDTTTLLVTVQARPTADFVVSDTVGCSPDTLNFTDLSAAGDASIAGWAWNFGGGNGPTTQQNPQATFTSSGKYTISLIATDASGCADTLTRSNYIRLRNPVAHLTVSNNHFCVGEDITLRATTSVSDTPLVYFAWVVSNNSVAPPVITQALTTADSLVMTNVQPGEYSAVLLITDVLGCADTVITQVLFRSANHPIAATNQASYSGCQPFVLQAMDASAAGAVPNGGPVTSFRWDFGIAASTTDTSHQQNPAAFTYSTPGTYTLTLAIADSLGCTDTTTATVTVFGKPVAGFSAFDTLGCAPQLIAFTDTSTGPAPITSWTWQMGTGDALFTQNPAYTYANDGTFTVSLEIADANGCRDTIEKQNYIVLEHPTAIISSDRNISCDYDSVAFMATTSVSSQPITGYSWVITDGNGAVLYTSAVDSFKYAFSDTGFYYIALQITNDKGCTDTDVDTFQVVQKRFPDPVVTEWVSTSGAKEIQLLFNPDPKSDFLRYYIYRDDALIDSIGGQLDTLYTDPDADVAVSHCYKIQTKNVCMLSSNLAATDVHCSVAVSIQPGQDSLSLQWNAYVGWPVQRYEIYRVGDYTSTLTTPFDTVPGSVLTYIDTATFCRDTVGYRVVAVKADTLNPATSASNLVKDAPIHFEPTTPLHINLATVVGSDSAAIYWSAYNGYKPSHYVLERSLDQKQWAVLEAHLSPKTTSYIDIQVPVSSQPVSYRIAAVDSCGAPTLAGRIGQTIYLEAEMIQNTDLPTLTWTPYLNWPNGVAVYEIYLLDANGNPVLVAEVNGSTTQFTDRTNVRNTLGELPRLCYLIVAIQGGGSERSASNVSCVPVSPKAFVPNIFTPNGDGKNQYFAIESLGTVETWTMRIFDRWGHEVATVDQNDLGWDGKVGKGTAKADAPEGTYLYLWTGVGYNAETITRSGYVILVR